MRIAYERERQHELLINKHTLLLSRGIKYKLDACMKARTSLARLVKNAPTARKTHLEELSNRKLKVEDAVEELKELEKHLYGCAADVIRQNDQENQLRYKEAEYEVRRQKIRIAAFERSVISYAKRGEVIPQRMTRARVEADKEFGKNLDNIYEDAAKALEKEEDKHAPKRLEDTAVGRSAEFNRDRLKENDFGKMLGGGWGDPNSGYEPPPQITTSEVTARNTVAWKTPDPSTLFGLPEKTPISDGGWGNANAGNTPPPQTTKPPII